MVIYQQGDPRWSQDKMGKSNATVGRYGCLITALMSLNSWYNPKSILTPGWAARKLLFTTTGLLYWKSIDMETAMKFVYRYYREDKAKILSILSSKDNAAVLEVPLGTAKHWVLLTGYSRVKGYRVADPLHGDTVWLSTRYKAPTGFAEITRNK